MLRSTDSTPPKQLSSIQPALATVAEIAALLASGGPLEETIPRALATTQRALSGEECVLWLVSPSGISRASGVGASVTEPATIRALLETHGDDAEGIVVARLSASMRRVGALSLRRERPLDEQERVLFATIGNLIAPTLAHSEYSRQLEVEVKLRTRQIEEQRRFTERIIDSLPMGVYVIDREYRIHAWNRKRETGMQGVSREEAIGRTIFEILHRQPAELLRREFDDVFETGRIQQFQMESEATGEVRTYRISKIPMRVSDATVTHVITIGEDITDWKEAQERFAQSERLAAIGQLAAGVMHEINNPLATIAACAESLELRLGDLRDSGLTIPTETSDYTKIIDNEVHRCKRIVDGLLDFSRPKPVTKTSVDVNEAIEQTLFLLKHHSKFKKVTVVQELSSNLGATVTGNRDQLVQVFMALLLNAMDAMGERGTITLRTRRLRSPDDLILAEVIDQGLGIRRSEVNKIFEPFYTTKPPGRGTGLGLSICYGIVADHGGRIEVDSTPGAGSTFRLIFPAGEAA